MPQVSRVERRDMRRDDVVKELISGDNIGIELGVAEGVYARRIIDSGKFTRLYGVDRYGGTKAHGVEEYKRALRRIGIMDRRYSLLRMSFDEALDLFEDNYFDYIYIDGFAHTGEEGGKTIVDWYPKLKVGGILAGDDYHDDWPLVCWAVNDFVKQLGAELFITGREPGVRWCQYPTWFIRKPPLDTLPEVNRNIVELAAQERLRDSRRGSWSSMMRKLFRGG